MKTILVEDWVHIPENGKPELTSQLFSHCDCEDQTGQGKGS